MSLVEGRGLVRVFGSPGAEVAALRGADIRIEQKEIVAIVGPSGCGKSTLISILGGLDRPTGGEVWLDGKRIDDLSASAWARLRRKSVGFVFQSFNLVENLSAADNIELPALIAGSTAKQARIRREELLERLGLSARAKLLPSQLSGGERQRVAVARGVVNRPTILFADEPTGALDSEATVAMLNLFRDLHHDGQTTVIVTHDPLVAAAANRIVAMKDGVVVSADAEPERKSAAS
ncbi:MAG: ABC transporter ATP-binding protein [bacterium]